MQLAREEAESAFTATGELSKEAIQGARQIIPPEQLGNHGICGYQQGPYGQACTAIWL